MVNYWAKYTEMHGQQNDKIWLIIVYYYTNICTNKYCKINMKIYIKITQYYIN